jgi:hypothetical protein
MKRTILAAALTLSLVSTMAIAQPPMHSTAEGNQPGQMGQGMMMGQGRGMMGGGGQGSGMMGMHGKGMGMMGMHGKGMGMMGKSNQCMMGQGMHGAGMMGSGSVAKRDAFLDSTKELRKSIHDKQFEYMEASRNSEETVGGLRKKAEELSVLRQDLMEKRQKAFSKE